MTAGFTLDRFVPYLLNRVVNQINVEFRRFLRESDLTFNHWRVLACLEEKDGRTMGQVAQYTATDQPTFSRVIAQMVARGLIRREPDPADARFIRIHLQPAGRDAYRLIQPVAERLSDEALLGLSPQQVAGLTEALRAMIRNLEPGHARSPPRRTWPDRRSGTSGAGES